MITRSHPWVKRIRALRDDPSRRREERVLVAEGLHLAEEALRAGVAIDTALVAPSLADATLREALARRAERFEEAPEALLDALQDARTAQPVLLVVRDPALPPRAGTPLVVIAAGIQDPGNLGALVRTADAAGATAFVSCAGADLHHPRAVRATMGAIFRLSCTRASLDLAAADLRRQGLRRIGADAAGAETYTSHDWTIPTALVLGGEGAGLAAVPPDALDGTVRIPMERGCESLSVAAAGAVLLFEAARQRRLTTAG